MICAVFIGFARKPHRLGLSVTGFARTSTPKSQIRRWRQFGECSHVDGDGYRNGADPEVLAACGLHPQEWRFPYVAGVDIRFVASMRGHGH